jgi:gluconokinase
MGVSGSGKSTVAAALARRLGWPMAEGDDFHPRANVASMRRGVPLTDDDRLPWLRAIAEWIADRAAHGSPSVVACSALRRSYRDVLRTAGGAHVRFVHVHADADLLAERMRRRRNHFMPAALLASQLQTLEPPAGDEDGVVVEATAAPERIVDQALAALGLRAGSPGGHRTGADDAPDSHSQ